MLNLSFILDLVQRTLEMPERPGDTPSVLPYKFGCEMALRVFMETAEFALINEAWELARKGKGYASSSRTEAMFIMVDRLAHWGKEGLLPIEDLCKQIKEKVNHDS